MARVYLSSTYEDLKRYREVAHASLLQMQLHVIAMEDYVASAQRPLAKCLDDVRSCDLYIAIIGARYGFVPREKGNEAKRSITELEYREAQNFNRPTLVFVLIEGSADQAPIEQSRQDRDRLQLFKAAVGLNHIVSFVNSPEDFGQKLSAALYNWQLQRSAFTQVPNLSDVVENKYIKVLSYVPGRRVKLRWYPPLLVWAFGLAIGGLVAWAIVPAGLGLMLGSLMNASIPGLALGAAVSLGTLWLVFWPPYISFNLRNSWTVTKVPGAWTYAPMQARQLRLRARRRLFGDGWKCRLSYQYCKIAETGPYPTREAARRELEPFALALNHAMGLRVLGD
jgi:hypothetical protein